MLPSVMFGAGFTAPAVTTAATTSPKMEATAATTTKARASKTKVSKIGGKKIREKKGALTKALGKPAMKATKSELRDYVDSATGVAKKKRNAQVSLMKAHRNGLKVQNKKVPRARAESVKKGTNNVVSDSFIKPHKIQLVTRPTFAVVHRKYSITTSGR